MYICVGLVLKSPPENKPRNVVKQFSSNRKNHIMNDSLIIETEHGNCTYLITQKGENYLKQITEKLDYEAEKERIEFEKSKTDLVLAQKMLKEFPKTKLFSRISLFIAIVLALKELYILIKPIL